jgi:hypothetical protein
VLGIGGGVFFGSWWAVGSCRVLLGEKMWRKFFEIINFGIG